MAEQRQAEKRLKVLFVSTRAPFPPNTGHFQRTFNIIRQVSGSVDIYLVAFYNKRLGIKEKEDVKRELLEHSKGVYLEDLKDELSVLRTAIRVLMSFFMGKPYVAARYYQGSTARTLERIIKEHEIDVVHLDMLPLAEYMKHIGDVPVVLTNHNVESLRLLRRAETESGVIKRGFLTLQAKLLYKYERVVMESLKHCVAVSEEDKNYLKKFNTNCDYYVVPNGVDLDFYQRRGQSPERNTLLWVGSMGDPYNCKGIEYFVEEVFPGVLERYPDVRWNVVGKEPPKVLKDAAIAHPENIFLFGYVDDVRSYYEQSDVLVVPLLSGSGTKLKVIEGMAMSMPIVTTTIGAEGLELTDGSDVYIADDSLSFVNAVGKLLDSPDLRVKFSTNVRNIAECHYGWDAIGKGMVDVYNKTARPGT